MFKHIIKTIRLPINIFIKHHLYMSTRRSSGQSKIELYKKIKQRDNNQLKSAQLNEELLEKHYKQHRCNGCNSLLQSQDMQKYGYISEEILNKSISQNIKLIQSSYGSKVEKSDAKSLQMIQQVQREMGVKIFNNSTKKLDNLDDVGVLLRLQEKIDDYEETEQTIRRSKAQRTEIFCYRCYTLKYHNKLPEQYNVSEYLLENNQQQIMNKVFKKHKDLPVLYLYVIDVLDICGSLQKYVFLRLLETRCQIAIIVNKLDIINHKYLNKHLILQQVRKLMTQFITKQDNNQYRQLIERVNNIKIFLSSNVSRVGIKNLQEHIEKNLVKRIQLVGFPNTGKTTLLNQLAKINRPTSKVPGTTVYITENKYKKRLIYDMPGMYSDCNIYNLIQKPNLKSLLAWNKFFSPPILLNQAFFFGGKIEIKDTKIILFGLGGCCSSDNRWFLLNYKEFWKGLPSLQSLNMTKYEFDIHFKNGKTNDIQIAGWGFIGLRLAIPSKNEQTRKLTIYLPKNIMFRFRESVLTDDQIFKFKSNVVKRFRLQRINDEKKKKVQKSPVKSV